MTIVDKHHLVVFCRGVSIVILIWVKYVPSEAQINRLIFLFIESNCVCGYTKHSVKGFRRIAFV